MPVAETRAPALGRALDWGGEGQAKGGDQRGGLCSPGEGAYVGPGLWGAVGGTHLASPRSQPGLGGRVLSMARGSFLACAARGVSTQKRDGKREEEAERESR